MALAHYPVINKSGDTIASAVTNLDIHDISRAAKTYGVRSLYVVTPLEDQKKLVEKLVSHWLKGAGSHYNPKRGEALKLIKIKNSLEEVLEHIYRNEGNYPKTVVTSARHRPHNLGYSTFRTMLKDGNIFLLIFGELIPREIGRRHAETRFCPTRSRHRCRRPAAPAGAYRDRPGRR